MSDELPLLGRTRIELLQRAVEALDRSAGREAAVDDAVRALSELPVDAVPRAEREIRLAAEWWLPLRPHFAFFTFRAPKPSDLLPNVPRAELLFLFHGNGHVREAALRRLQEPLPSPFFAVALAWRLNDWVPQVRAAAVAAVERSFPETPPDILAEAALVILVRRRSWTRWDGEENALDRLARSDVAQCLADLMVARAQGPMGRILAQALAWPFLDDHLLRLSREAVQPAVRALALSVLLRGRARWPAGRERRWIDKSAGLWRWVPQFEERALCTAADRRELLVQGVSDPSGRVRLVTARALLREQDEDGESLLRRLAADRVRSVREVAAFALDRRAESLAATS